MLCAVMLYNAVRRGDTEDDDFRAVSSNAIGSNYPPAAAAAAAAAHRSASLWMRSLCSNRYIFLHSYLYAYSIVQ